VKTLSLLSKEKLAFEPTMESAMPLLGVLPSTQPSTNAVISTSTNWLTLDVVNATGWPPVADAPSEGALL
jgi:hypothetical protein